MKTRERRRLYMDQGNSGAFEVSSTDLFAADEKYQFKLSDILRKRHRPLLMVLDDSGELLHSSLPVDAPRREHKLLTQAHKEAKALFNSQFNAEHKVRQLVVDKPGERCALIMLNGDYFSLSLFPFYGPIEGMMLDQYAALVEPIAKPSADSIEFDKIRLDYRLSNREVDVLRAMMSGDTDKVIARSLNLSVETVRAYLKTLRAKLGVSTRTAIVHFAYEYASLKEAHRT